MRSGIRVYGLSNFSSLEELISYNIDKSLKFIESTCREPITVEYIEKLYGTLIKGLTASRERVIKGGKKVLESFVLSECRIWEKTLRGCC